MTTATLDTISTDALLSEIAEARGEIQKAINAMSDSLDAPGSWTERQRLADRERRAQLPRLMLSCGTLREQAAKAANTISTLSPGRERLTNVLATIRKEIDEAPDHKTIVNARESTHAWARLNTLRASITALERGVERFSNGEFALPTPLRELLTEACAHCGHQTVSWPGPLPELEAKIEAAEAVIAAAPARLASIRDDAKALLAEPVST